MEIIIKIFEISRVVFRLNIGDVALKQVGATLPPYGGVQGVSLALKMSCANPST